MNESGSAYPPYNIVKSENNYTITLAVAGFSMSDLDISVQENELIITGKTNDSQNNVEFLHKGIAGRSFERKFRLADTIKVSDANYENGLLHVFLEREIPEHQKPRKIEINNKIN
jgi:molecular chaperone IbpA